MLDQSDAVIPVTIWDQTTADLLGQDQPLSCVIYFTDVDLKSNTCEPNPPNPTPPTPPPTRFAARRCVPNISWSIMYFDIWPLDIPISTTPCKIFLCSGGSGLRDS